MCYSYNYNKIYIKLNENICQILFIRLYLVCKNKKTKKSELKKKDE
jgi:hypothetical protein